MKLEEGRLVQWKENDQNFTGKEMLCDGEEIVLYDYCDYVLVKHSYTGELSIVHFSKLSPYPSSPIPEPTK